MITRMPLFLALAVAIVAMETPVANASIQVGAGSGLAAGSVDSAGSRLNIDNTIFPNLATGTYDVLDFEYSASTNRGNVQPFLAVLTGTDMYDVIWVGPTMASPVLGGIETVSFGLGTQQFTLAAATDVYAGFNASSNTVYFGAGTTDHNTSADFGIVVGDSIGPFSHNDLNRSYAFEINVEQSAIPEPTTFIVWSLLGLSAVGTSYRRNRKV